jgi:hypothetical protein
MVDVFRVLTFASFSRLNMVSDRVWLSLQLLQRVLLKPRLLHIIPENSS